jgi:hypothetical protein
MKIAAFTTTYNDLYLPYWLSHYSKMVDDLYVVDSGTTDGGVEKASKEYKFEILHRDVFRPGYDHIYPTLRETREEIQRMIIEFLKAYDWVIFAQNDEFIIPDPTKYVSLKDYVSKLDKEYVYCNGYDVVQQENESPLQMNFPILLQRKYWVSTSSYSKPLLTSVPLEYANGFHYLVKDGSEFEFMPKRDIDLYLIHTARADENILKKRNPYRSAGYLRRDNDKKELIPDRFKNII